MDHCPELAWQLLSKGAWGRAGVDRQYTGGRIMFRAIERIILVPFGILGALIQAVCRPIAGFGMHQLAFCVLAVSFYYILEPYWPSLRRLLGI